MSSPWLKFYPSDWRADPALRMCSIAARGLWMEMLCLMHEASPRGFLLVNEKPVTERQLAMLAGTTAKEVTSLLAELEEAGVFSRDDNRTIFSRRMKRETEKATQDRENGRRGGNPNLKRGLTPPISEKVRPRSKKPEPEANSPAQHPDPEVRGGAGLSDLEFQLRSAIGMLDNDAAWLTNTAPIGSLIAEGYDLELEILPVLRGKRAEGKQGNSWAWYAKAVRDRPKGQRSAASAPSTPLPHVKVLADSPEGRAWDEHNRARGKTLPWLENLHGAPARTYPTRWPPGHDAAEAA